MEKLEVVNKKWVRVKLIPGNDVDGSVRILVPRDLLVFFCFIFFFRVLFGSILVVWIRLSAIWKHPKWT